MKRLIINADDFGMTAGINRAVTEAHQHGVLTSATMIAAGGAVSEAVPMTHAMPKLAVGCHVVLMHGVPLTEPQIVPSLLGDGRDFRPTFGSFAAAAVFGRLSPSEIAVEVRAQVDRVRSSGLAVSHLDTHKHAHAFPSVFRPLLKAAKDAEITAVRNPFEPEFSAALSLFAGSATAFARYAAVRSLAVFSADFRETVRELGIRTTDGTLGIAATSRWTRSLLERLLSRIPNGTWELICHPAYPDEDFRRFSSAGDAGLMELEALTSPWLRDAIHRAGIELISYGDL